MQYNCNQCDYNASQKAHLNRHKGAVHKVSNEPTIENFIRKLRIEHEASKANKLENNTNLPTETNNNIIDNIDNSISTQEMISDSRSRRMNKTKEFNCDQCSFKSGSETLVKRHHETEHMAKLTTEKMHTSKRIHCQHCDKKFNKRTTFQTHMNKLHKEIINDLPTETNGAQPRVTRMRQNKTIMSNWILNN